jgi:hypothetical protein
MKIKIAHALRKFWPLFLAILFIACVIVSCTAFDGQLQPAEGGSIPLGAEVSSGKGGMIQMASENGNLTIGLAEGGPVMQAPTPVALTPGEPLSEAEVQAIFALLPTLPVQPTEQVDFKLAQDPIPPPRPGTTVPEPFPPAGQLPTPVAPSPGPLEVLRFSPEGEITLAPFVSVTFNQPMVPLATLSDLAAQDVPVKIEPILPGTWRWLGDRTLTFQFDSNVIDRLPMATEYRVSVPAGTRSISGGVLAKTVKWTFTTPPLKMVTTYPAGDSQPLDPLFFIAFDQRIDPQVILENVQVNAGNLPASLVLAEEKEIQADQYLSRLVGQSVEGRWLVFRSQEPLPADTLITVVLKAGAPSSEGPLLTTNDQSFSFHTYAPLRVVEHSCGWYSDNEDCPPLSPFIIRFNNPLKSEDLSQDLLKVLPELPGASYNVYGDTIQIQGVTTGRTTYTVQVSKKVGDIFGQELGKDTSLTFKVGSAEPRLVGPDQNFVTVDPSARTPVFTVYTVNIPKLDVKIYVVNPSDWSDYREYLQKYYRTDVAMAPPGRLVFEKTVPTNGKQDVLTEVNIDLAAVLNGKRFGHLIVVVNTPKGLFTDDQDWRWRTVQAWVQVTQIGLDAFADHSEMVVWTTALQNGAPLAGVNIQADTSTGLASTGVDGLARFRIPDGASYLVASLGADRAMLPRSTSFWDDSTWQPRPINDLLRWYTFDDRQMYRPGEQLHLKGWLRQVGGRQDGDVSPVGGAVTAVNYLVTDPQGNDLGNGRSVVNALGGFDLTFDIPQKTNLGYAVINLTAEGSLENLDGIGFAHTFQIQEFRRPEFEVTARNETSGPYFVGDHAVVAVEAKYYAGGPLPNAEVTWQVTSTPGQYSPPNWPDFVFGVWKPWWVGRSFDAESFGRSWQEDGKVETFTGQTDATGFHYLRLDFEGAGTPQPVSVQAQATVMDVNRQAWTDTTNLLVHPANLYVGLRSEPLFVERGKPLDVDLIVTDLDGNAIPERLISVRAGRMEWKYQGGEWQEVAVDVQECSQVSRLEPVRCVFETTLGGSYQITAEVSDDLGRNNRSQLTRWVSGGQRPPARKVEQEEVVLIPDKETYQPGDVAQILVQSPFTPAEGLLTVSRSGLLYTQRFQIDEGTITLPVPILEKSIPDINLQVDLVGAAPRLGDDGEVIPGAPARPAYASGQLTLDVPPLQRTLSLLVEPAEKELEPGSETSLGLTLRDRRGLAVPDAELAVVVVDEAILALSDYKLADPLSVFYAQRAADVTSQYSRASIILVNPLALAQAGRDAAGLQVVETVEVEMMAAPAAEAMPDSMGKAMSGVAAPAIRLRADFNPLALFSPSVRTDANGEASLVVKLPDNLTRYRIMVVAVDTSGKQFGLAETNLVARLPLMVRPSAPRFLNFGDRFELPVVLQNQTDDALVADVAVQVGNLELTGDAGQRVTIPPRDRVEVRFPAQTLRAGSARIQVAAVSGDFSDAAMVEFPVYTPATSEAFAVYGVLDEGALLQKVAAPGQVFSQYGGLEISTSSTALQTLTDAVLYLVSYPFDCTEQIASRILGVAALRDVLSAFEAQGLPSPQALQESVANDIQTLQGLQNSDGGFPYWARGRDSIPFLSIHVAHALQRAELKGFAVPEEMQQPLLEHLRQIERYYPAWYSARTRYTLSAYALYVRQLMGDPDPAKAQRLIQEAGLEKLTLDALGWLWPVLQDSPTASGDLDAIRRLVNNRVVETAGAANFTTDYDDQNYLLLGSNRRTDAILLDALIGDNPQHDLIPKLVTGLLAHRTQGRWGNTQENVFVLLALDRYFNTYEAQTPDFVARLWLGNDYAGGYEFRGRSTERHETMIPMNFLVSQSPGAGQTQDLILSKEGQGRLYYRLGLRYAPLDLELDPLDMGFVVQRQYEAVDDPGDVSRDEDGVWRIKAGSRVRVRLMMVADNRRYHVALVDPVPAGLEIINPSLAVSEQVPQDPNSANYSYGWWWRWPWFDHQNLRDERAEAFTPLLWDGVYEYTYIARATTPGRFVVPPARAEEMYSPEVFGRSSSNVVIVESIP